MRNYVFGLLILLSTASAVQAIPSWMGVYGSYQRHTGQNPGGFTVLMNQDYAGLRAEVGIKVGSGPWTVHPMTRTGTVSINSIWSFTPAAPFPVNTPVHYYFHGYDANGGHIWDSNNSQNYAFTAVDAYVAPTWMGVYGSFERHNGPNPGLFTVLVNQEYRAGMHAGVGYRINGQAWQFHLMDFSSNYQGNSVWHGTPSSAFVAPATVEYYYHFWDDRGTKLWDSAGGANYRLAFTNNPPTWMGVYGPFARHSGENPGTFTVLVNRENYPGLEAGMGYSLNNGITWSFTNMTWQRDHEGNSVFEWTPVGPFTGQNVRYFFHAWDAGGASLWDVNDNQDYHARLFATPSNISTEISFNYNNNPTSIPIQAVVWIESGLYDGLRAGVVYRMGGGWKTVHLGEADNYDGWLAFTGTFSPGVEGVCRQEMEYYSFVTDQDGLYLTDGNQLAPKVITIEKLVSGWALFMVRSNQYLSTTSQQSRSVGYFKNSQVQAIRHKLLPDAPFGPWITMNEHHYFEVPNKVGLYTSVVETLSIFGCTTITTNIMGLASTNTAFVPATNFAARLREHLLSFMPANPSGADKYLFSSYIYGGNAVWSQNWTTNFDFSGIAWDRFQCGTLVSPRHMICAAHFPRFLGDKVTFHDRFGTPHKRTIVAEVTEGFNANAVVGDCHIYLLDQPLPDTVKWYKFLPPSYRYTDALVGAPVIMTDQEKKALVTKVRDASFGISYVKDDSLSPIFHENLVVGDSGHPVFVVVNGELVLVTLHTVGGTGGSGTFYSHPSQFSGFTHLFNRFSHGYSISLFDMTGWGTYLP